MRKRWEGNNLNIVENNVSRSEQATKPICDGPMGMEIENKKLFRPTALGEGGEDYKWKGHPKKSQPKFGCNELM